MADKKVAILVSTYNGENYIEEQLNSLINQTYKNIHIYIRDDGSKDTTIEKVKKYEKENKNITLMEAKNLGVVGSFYECLKQAFEEYEYFAYCDQDDKWNEDKIENAINMLEEKKLDSPTLYFSEFNYCDENLEIKATSKMNKKGASFRNALVECIASGNTMVFNKKMAKLILETNKEDICLHDWWVYLIVTAFGQIIYDERPSLLYRRTGNNVTPGGGGFLKLQIFRIKKFLFGDYFKNIKKQIQKFDKLFHEQLSNEDKKLISLFTKEKYSFLNALKKIFYPKRFRQNFLDEIFLRFIFLIGKL